MRESKILFYAAQGIRSMLTITQLHPEREQLLSELETVERKYKNALLADKSEDAIKNVLRGSYSKGAN